VGSGRVRNEVVVEQPAAVRSRELDVVDGRHSRDDRSDTDDAARQRIERRRASAHAAGTAAAGTAPDPASDDEADDAACADADADATSDDAARADADAATDDASRSDADAASDDAARADADAATHDSAAEPERARDLHAREAGEGAQLSRRREPRGSVPPGLPDVHVDYT
jgi:hypothetical protein